MGDSTEEPRWTIYQLKDGRLHRGATLDHLPAEGWETPQRSHAGPSTIYLNLLPYPNRPSTLTSFPTLTAPLP
ncbi:hypothetical protein NHX12_028933 [Muraenolepis orangiensis]|uniref:Uncharacterized protein n=1 Tax=Muraenolepis orangiensis TaxID=630683 RepID=A0A9Q0EAA4_9TELE|nr:hypothetical protein NHX12_028933 [Muraenolepis orangiensis]